MALLRLSLGFRGTTARYSVFSMRLASSTVHEMPGESKPQRSTVRVPPPSVSRVAQESDYLRVFFANGSHTDFHYFYLFHNCDSWRHPITNEPTLCLSKVPLNIKPSSVSIEDNGGAVSLEWQHDNGIINSRFKADWLRQFAYAFCRMVVKPPSSNVEAVSIHASKFFPYSNDSSNKHFVEECRHRLLRDGIVIVHGAGTDTESIIDLLTNNGKTWSVIPTHFGRLEDLRTDNTTNKNTDQLGYTNSAVELHTDQPFIANPPRYQLLQCMEPASEGGENYFCDAKQASMYLHSIDEAAFNTLTTTQVNFHRKQKQFTSLHVGPLIELDKAGQFSAIRFSYFTLDPLMLPFSRMPEFYRSYQKFASIVNSTHHQYRAKLGKGDFVIYDNFRFLHARTAFSGPRWMRGIYFGPI